MKRFLACLLTLCLMLTLCPACAETAETDETEEAAEAAEAAEATEATEDEAHGAATNPYTFQAMDATINLPAGVTVTGETETDTSVTITLTMDGRTDVGLTLAIGYVDAYADYTAATLPDDLFQQLSDYYSQNFKSDNPPEKGEADDEAFADVMPITASGTGADGNFYAIFIMILNGWTLTVSGGIAAKEFDYESYGMVYNLYWQGVDMFLEME
ncbi:MAG: hypothetical protein PHY12_15695 [Eubacteriales bacterium]|nr:hypothetical protein [Eubacteriales bacterium]